MRAFLALELDARTHIALHSMLRSLQKAAFARDVKWVSDDNLHLTLRFLGEIDEAQKNRLIELLTRQMPEIGAPGVLQVSEPRLFPRPAQARIIICMVAQDAWLSRLADMCERCAQAIGLPAERRPFTSHITLGRTRKSFEWRLFDAQPIASIPLIPSGLALFKSTLMPGGAVYAPLARFNFAHQEQK